MKVDVLAILSHRSALAAVCLVQVTAALRRAGRPLPAFHPIELADASIRRLDARDVLAAARR